MAPYTSWGFESLHAENYENRFVRLERGQLTLAEEKAGADLKVSSPREALKWWSREVMERQEVVLVDKPHTVRTRFV